MTEIQGQSGMKQLRQERALKLLMKELVQNKVLYLMTLPAAVLFLLFNYAPLLGIIVAFKEFSFTDGLLGSKWANPIYNNFIFLISSDSAFNATRNTILLNALFIFSELAVSIALALILNEIRNGLFKKVTQSITFLPYFVSWIVVSVFSYGIFNFKHGTLNGILEAIGGKAVNWYTWPEIWPLIMLVFFLWKFTGYYSIIYLATLTGIEPSYYEAAKIDGATKMQQIRHISIPMLMPTAIVLTLLQVGRIMNADFGMFYGLVGDNSLIYSTTDVLDTFIFRNLRQLGDIGMASAAGFYQSVVGCIILVVCNKLADKYQKGSALF